MSWDDYDDRYFSDPSRRPRTGLVIVVSIAVSAATAAALFFFVGRPSRPIGHVPPLVGLELARARVVARTRGLTLVVTGKTTDPLVNAGAISTQMPLAGAELPAGAKVGVTISRGPAPRLAPRRATVKTTTTSVGSGSTPPIAAPGTAAKPDDAPRATRGSTRGPMAAVPSVIGTRLAAARWRLRKAGFRVGRVRYRADEDHIDGLVLSQRPKSGTRRPKGSIVDVIVNNTE